MGQKIRTVKKKIGELMILRLIIRIRHIRG